MDQIINELSLSGAYTDKYAANLGMVKLIDAAKCLKGLGYSAAIRTTSDFSTRELSKDYSITSWINDYTTPKEHKQYLLTVATFLSHPSIEDIFNTHGHTDHIEFSHEGTSALGLALGCLWNSVTLSLDCENRFSNIYVLLKKTYIDENYNLIVEDLRAITFVSRIDITNNTFLVEDTLRKNFPNGTQLMESSSESFPHLQFCKRAESQILALKGSELFFCEVVRHLYTLEFAIANYEAGEFSPIGIDYSPRESQPTMENTDCKQARRFICNDGQYRYFWAHSKVHIQAKRIHVFPDLQHKLIIIGYVGDHLPISSDI
ncbi:MAG: hypothetical protein AB9872_10255 [Solidesulfovibrio sp.]